MTSHRTSPSWTLGLTSIAFFMVALDALVVTTSSGSRDCGRW
jgi:hypothetical protein